MKRSRNFKLKASSLVESVMAIAIISICVFIATLVYVKLLETDYELAYYKAKQKVNELHLETMEQQLFENETYNFNSFKIEKKVQDLSDHLMKVQFEVQTKTKKTTFDYIVKKNLIEDNV